MFVPLGIVTTWRRSPWANVGLIALCVGAFWLSDFGRSERANEVAALWSRDPIPRAFVTHLFMHADWIHLVGNMVFLWAFGNAAGGRVHPALYVAFFLGAGVLAAAAELYATGLEAHVRKVEQARALLLGEPGLLPRGICLLGASGAIMGVAGLCLVLYPLDRVRGLFFIGWMFKTIEVPTILLVVVYAGLDLLYLAWFGHNGIAYGAHLAGFAFGATAGLLFLAAGWVERNDGDLLAQIRKRRPDGRPRASRLLHQP